MIKMCSWNTQAGGGSRVFSIVKAIAKSNSNIVVLNEFRNNDSGNTLRNYLLKADCRYQAVSHSGRNEQLHNSQTQLIVVSSLEKRVFVLFFHSGLAFIFGV
ncbi:MAG: hypothetical protein ACJA1A_000502 [Saprospiraceae bacterium]|jgi:hypothetical protein